MDGKKESDQACLVGAWRNIGRAKDGEDQVQLFCTQKRIHPVEKGIGGEAGIIAYKFKCHVFNIKNLTIIKLPLTFAEQ